MFFNTEEELQDHLAVNNGFQLKVMKPSFRQAASKYIIPVIGKDFFNELLAAYELGGATQAQLDAIDYLQHALANYGMLLYIPVAFVNMGNAGIQEKGNSEGQPSRQWVTYDLKKALIDAADTAMEDLLSFLEENADTYPTWKNSQAYTYQGSLLIQNISQLVANVGNLQQSRRVYLVLRAYLQKAEQFYIKPLLGSSLYTDLKGKLASRANLTDDEKELWSLCQSPLAHLALAKALPELNLQITEEGITYKTSTNGIIKEDKPALDAISAHIRSLKEDGDALLDSLKNFLLENADDYLLFQETSTYKNWIADDEVQNDPDCNLYIV
jgi:hypothetical protein